MKILMTGATRLQRLAPEDRPLRPSEISKIDVPSAIRDAMRRLGHTVEWRPGVVGEDLSEYDLVWSNMSSVLSPNATAGVAGGMLWPHSQDVPIVSFYDDWRCTRLGHSNLKTLVKQPEHFLTRVLVGPKDLRGDIPATWSGFDADSRAWVECVERQAELEQTRPELSDARVAQLRPMNFYQDRDAIIRHYDDVVRGAEAIHRGRPRQAIVVPMYSWGDPESVWPHLGEHLSKSKPSIFPIDPSHVTEEIVAKARPHFVPPEIRERAWALALLSKASDLLKTLSPSDMPTWPINAIGHRETGVRLDNEVDVLVWTSGHAGLLSLPYYGGRKTVPLKGWWRSRYLYGAAARVPVATAQGEAEALGPAYIFSPSQIEAMPYVERVELAEAQAAALRLRYTRRDGFDEQVARALSAAIGT
jgi:hypothetical protein